MSISCGKRINYKKDNSYKTSLKLRQTAKKSRCVRIMKITCKTFMSLSLQLEPRPAGERLVTSQVIIQRNLYGIWVLDREARSKNKRQFSKASSCSSSTNVPAPQLERRMEAARSIPTGISSPSQEKS